MEKKDSIARQFKRLFMELDLTDDQAKMIHDLQKDVNSALNTSNFYCLSDPKYGGLRRCNTQCKGCENSKNSTQ